MAKHFHFWTTEVKTFSQNCSLIYRQALKFFLSQNCNTQDRLNFSLLGWHFFRPFHRKFIIISHVQNAWEFNFLLLLAMTTAHWICIHIFFWKMIGLCWKIDYNMQSCIHSYRLGHACMVHFKAISQLSRLLSSSIITLCCHAVKLLLLYSWHSTINNRLDFTVRCFEL